MTQSALSHPTLDAPAKAYVHDLSDGQAVDSIFLVRDRARRLKKNGDPFLKLQLSDVTGSCEAVMWDGVDDSFAACAVGAVVRVSGGFSIDSRYGATLTVRSLRAAEREEYDPADLHDAPPRPVDQMVGDLRSLIETVRTPPLRELLRRFFAEGSGTWRVWSEAPAAKHYHQAYRHGLLEHCLTVAQAVGAVATTFPGLDRDVAVTGALLHDIGKIEAYAAAGEGIEMTDAGRLQGEIPLGYYMVRRMIEEMPGFPPDTAQAVLHIILSHHGALEHGSPVVPCTREATLVHMMDNLGGRLGSFDRIEKTLGDGEQWSSFDRGISAAAYFAPRENGHRPA
ncbi:MAG TPA: HD domain-containing protein [Thermoleophilaceae bacterium]|nr:HD domain-containing protein [Thermoleophilaceae bacterium]